MPLTVRERHPNQLGDILQVLLSKKEKALDVKKQLMQRHIDP